MSKPQRAPKGGTRYRGKFYKGGQVLPKAAKYGRRTAEGQVSVDPAARIAMAPPNFGRPAVPHIYTFSGIATSIAKTYRNPDEAIRHSLDNARIMRADCAIMECLEARQRITALLNWHLEPEDPKSQLQKDLCDRLTSIIKRIPQFTEYRRNLLEALWYGRYAVENVYGTDYSSGQRRYVIQRWIPHHGDKLLFRYEDGTGQHDPEQIGLRVSALHRSGDVIAGDRRLEQTDMGLGYFLEPWERARMTVHKHIIEDAPYEDVFAAGSVHGVGIRSRIYWSWFQKQETMAQLMEIVEATGQGFTVYYYPAGNEQARAAAEEVASQQAHTNVLLYPYDPSNPEAYHIERIPANTAGIDALKMMVHEFFGHQIKRYILGQILSSESEPTGMNSGMAGLHDRTLNQIARYDATKLEETLTAELVEPVKNFNDPMARNTRVLFRIDTESPDAHEKLDAYRAAYEMGARLREQDVMDLIGAAMPTEDERVLQNPTMKQQERLWNKQMGDSGGQAPEAAPAGPPPESMSPEDMFGPLASDDGGQAGEADPEAAGQDDPATARYRATESSRVGETKVVRGKTYRLNENSRWELVDGDEEGPQSDPQAAEGPQPQEFAATQLGGIHEPAAGLMRAFHEDPDFQESGTAYTRQVHPKVAEDLYGWMVDNQGEAGGGRVVDLGEGRMGFASSAGSIVVAPGEDGQWKVSYTVQTRAVREAMEAGGQEGPAAVEEQPAAPEPPEAPPLAETPAELPGDQEEPPGAGGVAAPPVAPQPPPPPAAAQLEPATAPETSPASPGAAPNSGRIALRDGRSTTLAELAKRAEELFGKEGADKLLGKETPAEAEGTPEQGETPPAPAPASIPQDDQREATQSSDRPAPRGKAPHEMTRAEFAESGNKASGHKAHLKRALAEGKTIPPEVLADYPELQPREPDDRFAPDADNGGQGVMGGAEGPPAEPTESPDDQGDDEPSTPAPRKPTTLSKPDAQALQRMVSFALAGAGLHASYNNERALSEAIERGEITTPDQLRRVATRAKKLHEKGNIKKDDHKSLQKALSQHTNRQGRVSPKQAIRRAAEEFDVPEAELTEAVDHIWDEKRQALEERELAKEAARMATGLNAGDIAKFENDGMDYTSDHPKLRSLDTVARSLAAEFPGMFGGSGYEEDGSASEDADYAAALWDLIKEGKQKPPSRGDADLIEEAVKFLQSDGSSYMTPEEEAEIASLPFSKRLGRLYGWFRSLYARKKSAPGQRGLFDSTAPTGKQKTFADGNWSAEDERKHPRDSGGKFAPKGAEASEKKDDDGFELKNDKPKPKPQEFDNNDKNKQKKLLSGLDSLPGQGDLFDDLDGAGPAEDESKRQDATDAGGTKPGQITAATMVTAGRNTPAGLPKSGTIEQIKTAAKKKWPQMFKSAQVVTYKTGDPPRLEIVTQRQGKAPKLAAIYEIDPAALTVEQVKRAIALDYPADDPRHNKERAAALRSELDRRDKVAESAAVKPLDHGELNVPLSKRGNIDAQIDRWKRDEERKAKQERKTKAAERRENKAVARKLMEQHGAELARRTHEKHGVDEREVLKTLDSMVKWEPGKARALLENVAREYEGADNETAKADGATAKYRRSIFTPEALAEIDHLVAQYSRGTHPDEVIARAARETDTNPTESQREAGNYRKGKCTLHGLRIAIENPAGSTRSGTDRDGKAWSIKMPYHYGYILRHESEADGDHVDVFLGPDPDSEIVFVVDQVNAAGRFDEHKVMLGWKSARDAKAAYLAAYSPGWKGFAGIQPLTMEQFKAWLEDGDTSRPIAARSKP